MIGSEDLDRYPVIYEDDDYLIAYEPSLDEKGPGGNVPVCYMAVPDNEEAGAGYWLLIDPDLPGSAEHWFELLHRLAQAAGDEGIALTPKS